MTDVELLEDLKSFLKYDKLSGRFTWIRGKRKGLFAGNISDRGYVRICFRGKRYAAHRLAWFFCFGYFPNLQVDHINRCRADNRISNLRLLDQATNLLNRGVGKTNTSGITGVYLSGDMWAACSSYQNKTVHLGRFATKEEAGRAYDSYITERITRAVS